MVTHGNNKGKFLLLYLLELYYLLQSPHYQLPMQFDPYSIDAIFSAKKSLFSTTLSENNDQKYYGTDETKQKIGGSGGSHCLAASFWGNSFLNEIIVGW